MAALIFKQPVVLDYVNSDDPVEIDKGIKETIKGVRLSIPAMGLGLAKIKSMSLYKQLNHSTMSMYIKHLCEETKMVRSSIYNWLYIGEAYIKYQNDLEMIDFNDKDGPTKLPYLKRALEIRQGQDVFEHIKHMSVREFIDYSKGELDIPEIDIPKVTIRGNVVYIKGKRAIIINKNLGKKTTEYFMKVIHAACEAYKEGGVILPVRLRTLKEARKFNPIIDQEIEKMRSGSLR
jgi:hypothetical protein